MILVMQFLLMSKIVRTMNKVDWTENVEDLNDLLEKD
jgi:hypothetical protein